MFFSYLIVSLFNCTTLLYINGLFYPNDIIIIILNLEDLSEHILH